MSATEAAEAPTGASTQSTAGKGAAVARHWRSILDGVAVAVMLGLSFFGVAASDIQAGYAERYWYSIPVVFAAASILLSWAHSGPGFVLWKSALRQLLHWAGVLLGLRVVFYFIETDHFTEANAGLACGLLVALGALLAGVHGQWRLAPIGAALMAATAAVALIEENLWVLLGLALVGLLGAMLINLFSRSAAAAQSGA
jgi:hypothetical protein